MLFNIGRNTRKKINTLLPRDRLLSNKTPFPVREAFNTLRTNLMFALAPINGKVVLVTSANASECKSTTTVNLAVSLAQNGQKVLLIDADMRKPTQHEFFSIDYTHGLSRVLVGFDRFTDAVNREVRPNLDFLPSGVIPPNPSELLSSARMKVFLEKISQCYDYIIIDSPPANVVTDSVVLVPYVDGVLFVVRHGFTTTDDIRRATALLNNANANMLGFVLADVSTRKGSYGHKYYNYDRRYGGYDAYDIEHAKNTGRAAAPHYAMPSDLRKKLTVMKDGPVSMDAFLADLDKQLADEEAANAERNNIPVKEPIKESVKEPADEMNENVGSVEKDDDFDDDIVEVRHIANIDDKATVADSRPKKKTVTAKTVSSTTYVRRPVVTDIKRVNVSDSSSSAAPDSLLDDDDDD